MTMKSQISLAAGLLIGSLFLCVVGSADDHGRPGGNAEDHGRGAGNADNNSRPARLANMTDVEDDALDRCYSESGQDSTCALATCTHL